MLQSLHQKLGTAGFVISIVALVAALGGGAYAASSHLSGKQKKEVANIAKHQAKKFGKQGKRGKNGQNGLNGANGAVGPVGLPGAGGPQGLPGAKGADGATGAAGAQGANGANGEEGPEGPEGAEGETGFTETLPSEQTETGTYAAGQLTKAGAVFVPLSFPIPLAANVDVHFLAAGATPTAECPSGPAEPAAAPGNLCVYETTGFGLTYEAAENPETGEQEEEAGQTGASLNFTGVEFASSRGTWAVTAE